MSGWYEYADEMAARETRGQRQVTFAEWSADAARAAEARDEAERRRFAASEEDGDVDISF